MIVNYLYSGILPDNIEDVHLLFMLRGQVYRVRDTASRCWK